MKQMRLGFPTEVEGVYWITSVDVSPWEEGDAPRVGDTIDTGEGVFYIHSQTEDEYTSTLWMEKYDAEIHRPQLPGEVGIIAGKLPPEDKEAA